MDISGPGENSQVGSDQFRTTQWSVVLAARADGVPEAHEALASLCQKYWGPLYAYVRRRGYSIEDAQDITQGFFATFLERDSVREATPERGKFRAYLLAALKHYMVSEWRREQAQKRGGGQAPLSLDFDAAESAYGLEPADGRTPESIYERRWVLELLARILERAEAEYADAAKDALFQALRPCLAAEENMRPYGEVAAELGMSEGAVKVAVHRLRKRFGELLRAEIAHTLREPGDVDSEIRLLFSAL